MATYNLHVHVCNAALQYWHQFVLTSDLIHIPSVSLVCAQVKGVMVSNIEKVTQRGDKLDDLGERAGKNLLSVLMYL